MAKIGKEANNKATMLFTSLIIENKESHLGTRTQIIEEFSQECTTTTTTPSQLVRVMARTIWVNVIKGH